MTNRVAELRLQRGWTQQQLGNIVRVSRQTVIAIEKGNYEPSTSLALKLATALGEPVEAVFTLTPQALAQVRAALSETPGAEGLAERAERAGMAERRQAATESEEERGG